MNKKVLFGVIAVVLVALLGWYFLVNKKSSETRETVKIGAVLPLTGSSSYYGNLDNQGILIAVEHLKNQGYNIEYYVEDNMSNTSTGMTAAKKLIDINKVDAIISTPSSLSLSLNAILEGKDIIHIAISNHEDLLKTNSNTIRAFSRAEDDATIIGDFVKEKSMKKIMAFVLNSDYGIGLYSALTEKMENITIDKELIDFNTKDFKNIILKNKIDNYDAIIILEYGTELSANLIKQIREYNKNIQLIGTSSIAASSVIKKMNSNITDGLVCASTKFDVGIYTTEGENFKLLYAQKYNDEIGMGQAYSYDAVVNFIKYYDYSNKTGEKGRLVYSKLFKDTEGVVGKFSYLENGDIALEMVLAVYRDGKVNLY